MAGEKVILRLLPGRGGRITVESVAEWPWNTQQFYNVVEKAAR